MDTKAIFLTLSLLMGPTPAFTDEALTLEKALELTKNTNPLIKALNFQINAASGQVKQAGLSPNPQITYELENFGGDFSGIRVSESTLSIGQPILLGGKIRLRVAASVAEKDLVITSASMRLNEILSRASIAYAALQKDEALFEIAKEERDLSREVVEAAKKRLKLGGVLAAEVTRAKVNQQNKGLALELARASLEVSRIYLASFWDGAPLRESLRKQTAEVFDIRFGGVEVNDFPSMRVEMQRIRVSHAKVALARALGVPDVNAQAGIRRFEETNGTTFVAALSMPLSIFDRNQGAIEEAENLRLAARHRLRNVELQATAKLDSLRQRRGFLMPQYQRLRDVLLKDSNKALQQIKEAYVVGRVGYFDLADTQRSYFAVKRQIAMTIFALNQVDFEYAALAGTFAGNRGENLNG